MKPLFLVGVVLMGGSWEGHDIKSPPKASKNEFNDGATVEKVFEDIYRYKIGGKLRKILCSEKQTDLRLMVFVVYE